MAIAIYHCPSDTNIRLIDLANDINVRIRANEAFVLDDEDAEQVAAYEGAGFDFEELDPSEDVVEIGDSANSWTPHNPYDLEDPE